MFAISPTPKCTIKVKGVRAVLDSIDVHCIDKNSQTFFKI